MDTNECDIDFTTGIITVKAIIPDLAVYQAFEDVPLEEFGEMRPTLKDQAWADANGVKNPVLETVEEYQMRLDAFNAKKAAFDAEQAAKAQARFDDYNRLKAEFDAKAKIERHNGFLENARIQIGKRMISSDTKAKRVEEAQRKLDEAMAEPELVTVVKGE